MDESPRSDNTDQPKHVALEQAVSVTDFSQPSSETDLTKALDIDSYDEDEVCHSIFIFITILDLVLK